MFDTDRGFVAREGEDRVAAGGEVRCSADRSGCSSRALHAVPARDVPPAAARGLSFADAAATIRTSPSSASVTLYLSPVLQAAPARCTATTSSTPNVSADLGEEGLRALAATAREAGLGLLLDIVPNHMSITGTDNRWWRDVLERSASFYANAFDVDRPATGNDRVVLPVLGERYRALTSGVLGVERAGGLVAIRAHDMRYPCSPRILGPVVRDAGRRIVTRSSSTSAKAPSRRAVARERDREARRRQRRRAVLLARLEELCTDPRVDAALDAELAAINADPLALDALLEAQNYRFVHWTVAGNQLSYRRLFEVTSLVGIRAEDPDVLAAGHRRIFGWLADGTIDGVRVDHVDGLREPGPYLATLRAHAPDAWILVEKILGPGERLPARWPIEGTTGYEHAEWLGKMIVDRGATEALAAAFTAYTGLAFDPPRARRAARLEVMSDALHSEIERITELAVRACATSPLCRDFTRSEIRTALSEILAGYPVYRTYLGDGPVDPADLARIATATEAARVARPEIDGDLLGFLASALSFEMPGPEAQELALVVQQVSGPVVAKGDEDTLSYRMVALASRCEVGAELGELGAELLDLHAHFSTTSARGLVATSTHDTKRSEDVRARIAAISERPAEWARRVTAWGDRAAAGWGEVERDRVIEYLMFQTLVGAWPLPLPRAERYAEKASREARLRTSWRAPDAAYEAARQRWLAAVYDDAGLVGEIAAFATELARSGDRNALAMLLVKLCAPGVPDLYQGSELRADALVDPDNRAPVDLALRQSELRAIADLSAADVAGDLSRAKLFTIRRVLGLRRRMPALFAGAYRPVRAAGPHADRLFAFARGEGLVVVVPRFGDDDWAGTTVELPPGSWRDVLAETRHPGGARDVTVLFGALPIALLVGDDARERERSADPAAK